MVSVKFSNVFESYQSQHRHPLNQALHSMGIPLILISLFGLLSYVQMGSEDLTRYFVRPDLGALAWLGLILFYLFVDWKLGVPFSLFALGLYWIGRSCTLQTLLLLQGLGWLFQFLGHWRFEKNSPAFFADPRQLLIGPLWVFAKWTGYGGSTT